METPILVDARARRDKALAEASRWSTFIDMFLELYGPEPEFAPKARTNEQPSQPARAKASTGALADTERAAISALQKAGRSLPTRDLVPLVRAAGVVIGGQDEVATLSARLSRSQRLKNERPNGWRVLEEVPEGMEAADHLPKEESAASLNQPPEPDESRTEVAHDNIDNDFQF